MTMSQALERMGRTTITMIYGLSWGAIGSTIGAAALAWIPVVGPAVGGFIGGMIGYMAGSVFGEAVYKGPSLVKKGVAAVCKSTWNAIKAGKNRIKTKLAY